ncbi:probable serine/threonine-protein kinase clkA isoform X1 [Lucilia sericata]|uniref:probable serine/threonine-protein kinase clkA isoform X1 n=2 Tax=Lucilia sericata TaxID=13632 RepID=UPI0018A87885|nr:probable serine/threonine-protein kinase clkA isoform X1 [Lucilia sericata]
MAANMISNNNNTKSKNGGMARGGLMSNSSSASNISTATAASSVNLVNTTTGRNVVVCGSSGGGGGGIPVHPVNDGVTSLSDLRSYLQPINSTMSLPPGVCPYDHIIEMIRGLDLQDDGITMNHKIKSIETDFCNIVRDENMLCESMEYLNDKALEDGETALKFALLFASHNFDVLAMKETKVRTAMLTLLQKNFVNAENYRLHDRERLYNSITLLGEYYHRVRLADNSPINILGESLLGLLIREIKEEKNVNDVKLAKLILSQITLNGDLMRNLHKTEISQLLYHIRKNLIEQPNLKPTVKAIMLMTLDLFYSNFASLGSQLEVMYTKYFIMEDDDEGNNNQNSNQQTPSSQANSHQQQNQTNNSPQHQQQQQQNFTCPSTQLQQQQNSYDEVPLPSSSNNTSYENGDSGNVNDNTEDDPDSYKKWSEQVCEDSFEEYNGVESELNLSSSGGNQDQLNRSFGDERDRQHSSNRSYDNDSDRQSRNSRRSFQPRQSPRPLKQNFNSNEPLQNSRDSQNSGNEERDESKPLPRWRAPRFNRDDQNKDNRSRNAQRRFSASFDDDRQSIRSDGGSIRLYSINDRLKHAQEKIERSGNQSSYTGIANSNWDRQSQRDDRSERSYMSNYERGNNHRRGGGRHYNNRPTYDKPPRFQKNNKNSKDKNSDTWRSSNSNLQYVDENSSYNTNGPESNSRSSSRARTLPRPAKSRIDGNNQSNNYRRSQSPNSYQQRGGGGNHHHQHHNQHQNKNRSHKFGSRYSSQSSLASDASSTLDRRHHQRNRSFSRRTSSQQQQDLPNDIQHWNDKDTNSELVRNARQTTDYMNYLSSKK